jgi:hypothetical protein
MSQLGNTRTDFNKILYWAILRNVVEPSQFPFAPAYSGNRFTCRLMWISTSWWSVTQYTFTAKMSRKCVMENKGHALHCNQYLRKYRGHLENYRKETICLRFTNVCRIVTDGLTMTRKKENLYGSQYDFMSYRFISLVLCSTTTVF